MWRLQNQRESECNLENQLYDDKYISCPHESNCRLVTAEEINAIGYVLTEYHVTSKVTSCITLEALHVY